jgi:hypothetical protein
MLFAKFTLFAVLIVLASAGNPYRRERESGERGKMRESGERGKMRESGERHEYGVHSYKRSKIRVLITCKFMIDGLNVSLI